MAGGGEAAVGMKWVYMIDGASEERTVTPSVAEAVDVDDNTVFNWSRVAAAAAREAAWMAVCTRLLPAETCTITASSATLSKVET